MGGLEEIIRQIKTDADTEAKEILDKANNTCDSIRKETTDEIERIEKTGAKKAENKAKLTFDMMKSTAQMEAKQEILRAKQEIISDMIDKAYNKISNLPDAEYFEILLKIVEKYSQPEKGMICFNEKDLKRVPSDFEKKADEIAKKKNGSLEISKEAVDIENGVILDYGDIEENCTLKALFNNKRDVLQDEMNVLLFK